MNICGCGSTKKALQIATAFFEEQAKFKHCAFFQLQVAYYYMCLCHHAVDDDKQVEYIKKLLYQTTTVSDLMSVLNPNNAKPN